MSALSTPSLPSVVLIDDEPEEIFFAVHALKKGGVKHPVTTFEDPEKAIDHFKRACASTARIPVAAVFCDVKMPELTGFEVVRILRAMPQMKGVPIWMISGSDAPSDLEAAKNSGADGYIVKPANPAQIAAVVHGQEPPAFKRGSATPFGSWIASRSR